MDQAPTRLKGCVLLLRLVLTVDLSRRCKTTGLVSTQHMTLPLEDGKPFKAVMVLPVNSTKPEQLAGMSVTRGNNTQAAAATGASALYPSVRKEQGQLQSGGISCSNKPSNSCLHLSVRTCLHSHHCSTIRLSSCSGPTAANTLVQLLL